MTFRRIAIAAATVIAIALAIAVVSAPPAEANACGHDDSVSEWGWLRTAYARGQDGKCNSGDVCRELCMIGCDGSVSATGYTDCFSN